SSRALTISTRATSRRSSGTACSGASRARTNSRFPGQLDAAALAAHAQADGVDARAEHGGLGREADDVRRREVAQCREFGAQRERRPLVLDDLERLDLLACLVDEHDVPDALLALVEVVLAAIPRRHHQL